MRLGIGLALLAAVLALVAAVLGSCAGAEKRLTYPAFQGTASTICLRYHQRLGKLGAPSSMRRLARIARGVYRLGGAERGALGELRPPREAAHGYAQLLDRLGAADALLPDLWRAAGRGDTDRARALVRRGRAVVAEANVHARAVGLADCRRT